MQISVKYPTKVMVWPRVGDELPTVPMQARVSAFLQVPASIVFSWSNRKHQQNIILPSISRSSKEVSLWWLPGDVLIKTLWASGGGRSSRPTATSAVKYARCRIGKANNHHSKLFVKQISKKFSNKISYI